MLHHSVPPKGHDQILVEGKHTFPLLMLGTKHSLYGTAGKGDVFQDPSRHSVGSVNTNVLLSGQTSGPVKSATAQGVL